MLQVATNRRFSAKKSNFTLFLFSFQGNRRPNECPGCDKDKNCPTSRLNGNPLCWAQYDCQKICPSQCPDNCFNNGTECCPDKCVGGCNGTECIACRHFIEFHNGESHCVDKCSKDLYAVS